MVNLLAAQKAAACFVGAWGFINSTLVNTTTGERITDDWGYPVPSGLSLFTPNGWCALLVSANDTTMPDLRPRFLDQSNITSGTDADWANIGKYSIAGAGPYRLSNVTSSCRAGEGPQGVVTGNFITSTLPSREGLFDLNFKFYESCHVWNLHQYIGGGLERVVWYEKQPDQQVY
ncbi:Lipocalin-like domain-containing protein [Apiospora arundinis]